MAEPTSIDTQPGHDRTIGFLRHCHRRLATLADGPDAEPSIRAGAAALGAAIDRARPRRYDPAWQPVIDSIDRLPNDGPLAPELADVARDLRWIPTPRSDDDGNELALAPLDALFDLGSTVVGVMYVGPGATYPLHHHPPQELYLTLAGSGRWRYGGNIDFETVAADRTLYNHPDDPHSAIAEPESPLVALYVLW